MGLRELSLYTGIGGGVLATQHLLGWRTLGYVDSEEYCQKVIARRIKDGYLNDAPIYGDIQAFIDQGYADAYQGVDVVTGGFPCQCWSEAGKQLGEKDPRNLWPQTCEAIRVVRPRFAFMENVPALLGNEYWGTILGDMATLGYHVRWCVLSAADIGSTQIRKRLWILGWDHKQHAPGLSGLKGAGSSIQFQRSQKSGSIQDVETSWLVANGYGTRTNDGLAGAVDRIKGIGNSQFPAVVALAWQALTRDIL